MLAASMLIAKAKITRSSAIANRKLMAILILNVWNKNQRRQLNKHQSNRNVSTITIADHKWRALTNAARTCATIIKAFA
jgi:hypothetical protein